MYNKRVKELDSRKKVLEYLDLIEKHDKFTNITTLDRRQYGDKIEKLKLTQGWSSKNVSTVVFQRNQKDSVKAISIDWEFINDTESTERLNNLITITGLTFLVDGQAIDLPFKNPNHIGNTKTKLLDEKIIKSIIDCKSLEIRLSTGEGTVDYDEKTSLKLQKFLREFYERLSDLDEYDLLKEAESLNKEIKPQHSENTQTNTNSSSTSGSAIKWLFFAAIAFAAIGSYMSSSTNSKPPEKPSQPPHAPAQQPSKSSANAPSFDCNKASSESEHLICSSPELSKLDAQLAATYKSAKDSSSEPEILKTEQIAWVKSTRQCSNTQCLTDAYRARITQLSK